MAPFDSTASRDVTIVGEGSIVADGATWLARRERWLWIAATLALLADVTTTLLGLEAGLAEGNPFVANALSTFGVAGFLTIKAGALVLAYGARLAVPRYRVAIPLGVTLPWLAAAGANAALLLLAA